MDNFDEINDFFMNNYQSKIGIFVKLSHFALGAPRNQCSASTLLPVKTATLWRMRSLRRVSKANGTIAMIPSSGTFRRRLTIHGGKLIDMIWIKQWPQKWNLFQALMRLRKAYRYAEFVGSPFLYKAYKHVIEGPVPAKFAASRTAYSQILRCRQQWLLWDRRRHYVRSHCLTVTARLSPRRFAEAFTGAPWDENTHLRDVSRPGKWRTTFSMLKRLPWRM